MAAGSFGLFVQQLSAADDQLKTKVAQIVFDLMMVHDIAQLVEKTFPVSCNVYSPPAQLIAGGTGHWAGQARFVSGRPDRAGHRVRGYSQTHVGRHD